MYAWLVQSFKVMINSCNFGAQGGRTSEVHDGMLSLVELVPPCAPVSLMACLIIPAACVDLGLISQGKGLGWLER